MSDKILIEKWFVWRETHSHVQLDKEVIAASSVRFPMGYECLFQYLISGSKFMAQAYYRKLRQQGYQIVGEHQEGDEYFVMWKDRKQTGLLRMTREELKVEMQKKMEGLIRTINESPKPLPGKTN